MTDGTTLYVAQAICDSDSKHGYPEWRKLTAPERDHYMRRSKVAIEAMKTPIYSRYGVQLR